MYINRSSSEALTCKRLDGTLTCCADFERVSSRCFPCLVGYTSDSGQECKPCAANMFGVKCKSYCDCSEGESCHHIYGCTTPNIPVSSTKGVNDNFSSFTTVGQWNSSVKMDLDVNDSFYSITTTTKWSTTVTGDSELIPGGNITVYFLAVTAMLILVVLFGTFYKCYKLRRSANQQRNNAAITFSNAQYDAAVRTGDNGTSGDPVSAPSSHTTNNDGRERRNLDCYTDSGFNAI